MKLTQKKEIVVEEIDIKPGTYYFECFEGVYHKMILTVYEEEGLDYFLEEVYNFGSPYGIRVKKDTIFDAEELPYKFQGFLRKISGKKITKEEFEKEREDVLKRLEI